MPTRQTKKEEAFLSFTASPNFSVYYMIYQNLFFPHLREKEVEIG